MGDRYCLYCKTAHPIESSCPPYEVRTTGICGLGVALRLAEEEIVRLRAENTHLRLLVDQLHPDNAIYPFSDGSDVADRSEVRII